MLGQMFILEVLENAVFVCGTARAIRHAVKNSDGLFPHEDTDSEIVGLPYVDGKQQFFQSEYITTCIRKGAKGHAIRYTGAKQTNTQAGKRIKRAFVELPGTCLVPHFFTFS
jgi:hypothetical protein